MKTSSTIAAPQTTSIGPRCLSGGSVTPAIRRRADDQHLALLAQVAGQEDDDGELAELGRLEGERADVDAEVGAVDLGADPGHARQHQQDQPGGDDHVPVALEHVVVLEEDDRRHEQDQPDDEPVGLVAGEAPRRSGRASPARSPRAARRAGTGTGRRSAAGSAGRRAPRGRSRRSRRRRSASGSRPRRRATTKTAAKPATSRPATGTRPKSSRLRALKPPPPSRRRTAPPLLRRRRRLAAPAAAAPPPAVGAAAGRSPSAVAAAASAAACEVLDQRDGVVLGAQLVVGDDLAAVLGQRLERDRDRLLLGVELDPERQVVGQAAVEGDAAAVVGAEEPDLAGADDRAEGDRGEDEQGDPALEQAPRPAAAGSLAVAARRARAARLPGGACSAAPARTASAVKPSSSALAPISVAPSSAGTVAPRRRRPRGGTGRR